MREIPLFTLEGVRDADVTTHYFNTGDGLGLSMLRFQRGPADQAVMIIHGLTTSTDMFVMPEHHNLVSYLLDNGYNDVWCIDNRISGRQVYNLHKHRWTLDDVALYDYPPALELMRRHVGDRPIHVIGHCLGATSFAMSLFARQVEVASVILNSVALTPRVPGWSRVKLSAAPALVEYVLGQPYLNPAAHAEPRFSRGRMISALISRFHPECDVPACHMLSMMWGTGWPALYSHDNLADVTHRRGGDLYGPTSVHYYRHVRKMLKAGQAVKYDPDNPAHAALPNNYFRYAPEIETPILFMTGEDNKVFTDSNIVCHQRLERIVPGRHQLYVVPGYGHQDPFMGEHVARDVFPGMLRFLDEQRERTEGVSPTMRSHAAAAG